MKTVSKRQLSYNDTERAFKKNNNILAIRLLTCSSCEDLRNLRPSPAPHLLFLEHDVDGGEVFAVVVGLQLSLQAGQPLVEVGAALGEQLGLVGVKQTLGLGLGGRLQVLPHRLQGRKLFFNHGLCLRFLCHQRLPVLKDSTCFLKLSSD